MSCFFRFRWNLSIILPLEESTSPKTLKNIIDQIRFWIYLAREIRFTFLMQQTKYERWAFGPSMTATFLQEPAPQGQAGWTEEIACDLILTWSHHLKNPQLGT